MSRTLIPVLLFAAAWLAAGAPAKYDGPRPPKADLPYLLHADNLIPTEASEAREDKRKDDTASVITGAASSARTPLAEPIFLILAEKIVPEKLAAYRMEVRNGNRELVIPASGKRPKNAPKPIPLKVTRLDDRLYRVEVDNPLENGEYTLSPDGSNEAFSFQIY